CVSDSLEKPDAATGSPDGPECPKCYCNPQCEWNRKYEFKNEGRAFINDNSPAVILKVGIKVPKTSEAYPSDYQASEENSRIGKAAFQKSTHSNRNHINARGFARQDSAERDNPLDVRCLPIFQDFGPIVASPPLRNLLVWPPKSNSLAANDAPADTTC